MSGFLTGVDLGGTKTEIAVLNPDGRPRLRERVPTPAGGYDQTIRMIRDLVAQAETQIGQPIERVGIGTPGSLSPKSGTIRNANSTRLNGHPLDRDLAEATGCQIRLENDANCFALAEAVAGAGRGASCVFGVILGTGIGGGVILRQRPLIGANAIAGEWGHNPLPGTGPDEDQPPACYCGRQGCIEAWCSGPAMAEDHARRTGQSLTAHQIADRAANGDGDAARTLDLHAGRLGRALASVTNILDPDVIVLGGGLSNLAGLAALLHDRMRPHVFSDTFTTPIRRNELGDSAGVFGAAWLWREVSQ